MKQKRAIRSLMLAVLAFGVAISVVLYTATGSIPIRRTTPPAASNSAPLSPPEMLPEYSRGGAETLPQHLTYIRPAVEQYLKDTPPGAKVLDLGCGNGALLGSFQDRGWELYGLDISVSAIGQARKQYPNLTFIVGDATSDIAASTGDERFDVVISTEVIEHVYNPRGLVRNAFRVLKPGGMLVLSTPYHGYLKNLVIAVAGKTDHHFNPLHDDGHIKFFSADTLSTILWEAGFDNLEFTGTGRFPYMWKSMVIRAIRP